MKIFKCPHCKSRFIFTKTSCYRGKTGLYCGDCGKWIKWLKSEEIRLAQRQESIQREEEIQQLIKAISYKHKKEKQNENI